MTQHIGNDNATTTDAPFTDEQRDAYIASGGTTCPVCGSIALEGDSVDIDEGRAMQDVSCVDCNSTWTDVYTLTNIEKK